MSTRRIGLGVLMVLGVAFGSHVATRLWLERTVPDERIVEGRLASTILGEERPYFVHRPESYDRDPGRRYSVIYVLDGLSQSTHAAQSVDLLARIGVAPEAIVVGIPSLGDEARQRDYTPPSMRQDADDNRSPEGRADRFLSFLRDELVPRIEQDFRTTKSRQLVGNSRGGLFVVYSLVEAPGLFEARFALSPALWRDDDAMVGRLERFLLRSPTDGGFMFLSLGDQENPKMRRAFDTAVAVLDRFAPSGFRWQAERTRGATHQNNAQLSLPVGLAAFSGYHPPDRLPQ